LNSYIYLLLRDHRPTTNSRTAQQNNTRGQIASFNEFTVRITHMSTSDENRRIISWEFNTR